MSLTHLQALELVPEDRPNRDALARLLCTTIEATDSLSADPLQAAWFARMRHIGGLISLAECMPPGARAAYKVRTTLRLAVEAAKTHAYRHGLRPNARQSIRAEARSVFEALK